MPDCTRIDHLVTPFVDGELPQSEQEAVTRHIAVCPPCRARVTAETAVRTLVQARRPDLARAAAPPALKARCQSLCSRAHSAARTEPRIGSTRPTPAWRERLAPFALAAALVLIVGGAFLYQATRNSARVMAAELAADHVKCFRLNSVLGTQDSAPAVEAAMASGFGWNMHLPQAGRDGLNLVGSRPCLYGEGKVAHIMYTHHGEPVSLFMLPRETRQAQLIEVFGHQCRIWSEGDRTFVLVARESPPEMEQMMALVRETVK
jgi:anti-sigma factor RsiW